MDKYKDGTYYKGYFSGGSNIHFNLIMCEDKIIITKMIKSYVLHRYHKHLLHTGTNIMEAVIRQHLYWPGIRYSVRKELENGDTCKRKKRSNKKYGKLPANEAE